MSAAIDPALAASERATRFLARLERIGVGDLESVSFASEAVDARAATRAAATRAATRAGLAPLVEETRAAARDFVQTAYTADMYQPTWFGLNWGRSSGSIPDRVAIFAAVDDAAIATVAMDVVRAALYDELHGPYDVIESMHPPPVPDRRPTRLDRWSRPIAVGLLVGSISLTVAYASSTVDTLAVVVPVAMAVVIVASLVRQRPRLDALTDQSDDDPDRLASTPER